VTVDTEDKTAIANDQTMFFQRPVSQEQANRITIIEGELSGKVCKFGDSIVIGRGSTCRLTIENDPYISREHARIERKGKKKYRLINLENQNTTLLNGKEITKPAIIKSGAKIKIGDTTLKVDLGASKAVVSNTGIMSGKIKIALSVPVVLAVAILVLTIIPWPSPDVKEHLDKGNRFLKQKQYADAKHEFEQVLAIEDENEEASTKEKECVTLINEQEKRKAIENYLAKGRNCYENKDFHCALDAFNNVLKLDNENQTAKQKKGECEADLNAAEQKNIVLIADLLNTADRLIKSLQTNEIASLEALNQVHKRLDLAEQDINEAISLCDKFKTESGNKACRNAGSLSDAIEKTKKELNDHKQQLEAVVTLYEKAKVLTDLNDYFNALKVLEKLVEMNIFCKESINARKFIPKIKQMLIGAVKSDYNQGRKYFKKQKYSKAIPYLHKVHLNYPDYREIESLYRDTINKLVTIAERLIGEGKVYEGIGKMDAARKKWQKVLQIIPIESHELHQEAKRKLSGQ